MFAPESSEIPPGDSPSPDPKLGIESKISEMPKEGKQANPQQVHFREHSRRFEGFRFAYPVISRRSGGLSIGVNLNLDKACNFDCPYCQVDRTGIAPKQNIDIPALIGEVAELISTCNSDGSSGLNRFADLAPELRLLRDVAISGDGEPTMVPEFPDVCEALADLQSKSLQKFKLVLITNATLLNRPNVQQGLAHLHRHSGEVWAKLDAGTEAWYQRMNVSRVPLQRVFENLLEMGRTHPFRVQSFFGTLNGLAPNAEEINAYIEKLETLRQSGAQILEVQLYSLARTPAMSSVGSLPVTWLDPVAIRLRQSGWNAIVYGESATQEISKT